MTNEPKHTPTPWYTNGSSIEGTDFTGTLATVSSGKGAHQDLLNAAYIVRCVNAHEELRAAVRTLLNYFEGEPGGPDRDEAAAIRAILAKAEGRQ